MLAKLQFNRLSINWQESSFYELLFWMWRTANGAQINWGNIELRPLFQISIWFEIFRGYFEAWSRRNVTKYTVQVWVPQILAATATIVESNKISLYLALRELGMYFVIHFALEKLQLTNKCHVGQNKPRFALRSHTSKVKVKYSDFLRSYPKATTDNNQPTFK